MPFIQARRENVLLRMMLMGPTGAGKSRGALEVATHLFDGSLPIAAIDTEHGRLKLYGDKYDFKRDELVGDFSPEAYIAKMHEAEREFPGGILLIDSASHEWMGEKGILQDADRFGDWKTVRPRHNQFVEAMLSLNMHLIVCVRSKMKYSVTEYEDGGRTRQRIEKLGLGPIQDDTLPYEFDIVASIDVATHEATFSNRCDALVDQTFTLVPGAQVAEIITNWLSTGEPPAPVEEAEPVAVENLVGLLREFGIPQEQIDSKFAIAKRDNRGKLAPDYVAGQTAAMEKALAAKVKKEADAKAKEDAAVAAVSTEEQGALA